MFSRDRDIRGRSFLPGRPVLLYPGAMPFETELRIEETPGGTEFRLLEPLVYRGNTDRFVVPAGFVFDFASIPRFATWLVPKLGRYNKAACVHDWLYVEQPRVQGKRSYPDTGSTLVPSRRISRKDADGIFRRIMREEGVGWFTRRLMHRAVRIGGWPYWNRNAERIRDRIASL